MIRNGWLLDKLQPDTDDFVLAFRWPGTSPGTDGMIAMARQRGISVEVVTPDILA